MAQIQIVYMVIILVFYKIFFLNKIKKEATKTEDKSKVDENMDEAERLRSIIVNYTFSTFRTMVYMVTSISILAVDFQIYPRSNAKTETYGVSIMDLGVGAYVIGHALKSVQKSTNEEFIRTAKQSSFLILMGIGRLISVKSTNYVEHITEYGIHWNFFFTLAIVKVSLNDDGREFKRFNYFGYKGAFLHISTLHMS
jgi:hypothetical protein